MTENERHERILRSATRVSTLDTTKGQIVRDTMADRVRASVGKPMIVEDFTLGTIRGYVESADDKGYAIVGSLESFDDPTDAKGRYLLWNNLVSARLAPEPEPLPTHLDLFRAHGAS